MGSKLFRDPQALSSALASLGSPQPRAFGSLNNLEPLVSVSNYYRGVWCMGSETSPLSQQLIEVSGR